MGFGCSGARSTEPPSPSSRTCCLLTPVENELWIRTLGQKIADPSNLGRHKVGGGDEYGIVYTCNAGFLDLAHLRDLVDLTQYYYKYLTVVGRNKKGNTIPCAHYSSSGATILADVPDSPQSTRIDVARSMAFDESVFHEIETYWITGVGGKNSSFSPEDLTSNLIGTYVAGQALLAGGDFATAVTAVLLTLMSDLNARPHDDTVFVFNLVKNWFTDITSSTALADPDYLKQRNFKFNPIDPCLIPGLPTCTAQQFPPFIPKDFAANIVAFYDMQFTVPLLNVRARDPQRIGQTLKKGGFSKAVEDIKFDAFTQYGDKFDSCAP
jgi:hypothetical protein